MSTDSAADSSALAEASDPRLRLHAACDECRKRKLKCSGELSGCSRCIRQEIPCVYSQQKQMGRPRKKQKTGDETSVDEQPVEDIGSNYMFSEPPLAHTHSQPQHQPELQSDTPIDPSLANIDHELTSFHNVCTGPIAQTIRNQRNADTFMKSQMPTNMFEQSGTNVGIGTQHAQYPTDISQWPNFSTIDTLPFPLVDKFGAVPAIDQSYTTPSATSVFGPDFSNSEYDIHADPTALSSLPAIPACPCLPNLYLTLSTLSTLSTFPVSQSTIDTLLSAHRTAHSVIYCHVCPQQFQSGSQNLMLGCTLLNIVADHWHRIRRTSVEEFKKGFGTSQISNQMNGQGDDNNNNNSNSNSSPNSRGFISAKEGNQWRQFAKHLIRAYVFGDSPIPKPPDPTSSAPTPASLITNSNATVPEHQTLKYLISALRRRQRQWHGLEEATDEFPDRQAPSYNQRGRPIWAQSLNKQRNSKTPQPEHGKSTSDDPENQNQNQNHGHTHREGTKESEMLCLMIVKHSMDIVEALDEE